MNQIMNDQETFTRTAVQEYYGKVLKSSEDLKTNACCVSDDLPQWQKEILSQIDDEILSKFYGCGSPIPQELEGATVLDLGCGTGRDVYVLSKLVGPKGRVIGVDMTDEQLEVANRHLDKQTQAFGYDKANVAFMKGYIEYLEELDIPDNSVDVVISNCVINLSPNKRKVYENIFRLLKPGGELYISDVYASRRVPPQCRNDEVLHGECLSGAMYIEDFRRLLRDLGCLDYRIVSTSKIELKDPAIEAKVGMIDFYSLTVRAFKLDQLEDICEDYGQSATYLGSIPHHPHRFVLDDHHVFQKGKPMLVCGNTHSMLADTRFAKHFDLQGDRKVHYGPFDCGPLNAPVNNDASASGSCC